MKRVFGRDRAEPFRPLDEHDIAERFLPSEFGERRGLRRVRTVAQAPEVEVVHHPERRLIALHERIARARHEERGIARRRAQERTREHGLAGAERPREQKSVASSRPTRERAAQPLGRALVIELKQERIGIGFHAPILPRAGWLGKCLYPCRSSHVRETYVLGPARSVGNESLSGDRLAHLTFILQKNREEVIIRAGPGDILRIRTGSSSGLLRR